MKLPIYEMFAAFQGEGVHMGRSAFFIRTYGCPVHCKWCDSAGTWHKDFIPAHIERKNEIELMVASVASCAEFIIATGGEPAIHDFTDLISICDIPVHLETSGGFPLKGGFSWITVSPKREKPPLPEVLAAAHEFKIIVESADDIWHWCEMLRQHNKRAPIWLHPEWSKRNDPQVLRVITNAVKMFGRQGLRAGWQIHKLYRCDLLDDRSVAPVPLGGNPTLGF